MLYIIYLFITRHRWVCDCMCARICPYRRHLRFVCTSYLVAKSGNFNLYFQMTTGQDHFRMSNRNDLRVPRSFCGPNVDVTEMMVDDVSHEMIAKPHGHINT